MPARRVDATTIEAVGRGTVAGDLVDGLVTLHPGDQDYDTWDQWLRSFEDRGVEPPPLPNAGA